MSKKKWKDIETSIAKVAAEAAEGVHQLRGKSGASARPPDEDNHKTPEPTCKFCGGFLTLYKCQNWSLDLFGKRSRIKAASAAYPGFQFCDLATEEPVYIDGREASQVEILEFLDSCLKHNRPCELYGREFKASDETTFCQACDELLTRKAITNPCPDCLKNEPDAILERFDQSDKDALKAELGYPLDDKDYTVSEDAGDAFGKEWQGYRLEVYGVIIGRYSQTRIPDEHLKWMEKVGALKRLEDNRVTLKAWGLFPFTCIPHLEDPDLIVRLCRMRAFYEGSPLYSEMRAHPYGVRRVAIHGLEYTHTEKDLKRAVKGLDLLHKAYKNPGGRKKGGRKYSKSAFIKLACQKWQELSQRFDGDPRDHQLAAEMDLSRTSFYDHMADYDLQMSDLRARAKGL